MVGEYVIFPINIDHFFFPEPEFEAYEFGILVPFKLLDGFLNTNTKFGP